MIELVVGLGNPGKGYERTRHNAGWWLLDRLAQQQGLKFIAEAKFFGDIAKASVAGRACWLLKPTTFMNRSGQAIQAIASFYKISVNHILVVHDELDLKPGTVRLKQGGGHGGHNGLRSTIEHLGSNDFLRMRLGIGHPGSKDEVVNYVLHQALAEEQKLIDAAIDLAVDSLPLIIEGDVQKAMQRLHS